MKRPIFQSVAALLLAAASLQAGLWTYPAPAEEFRSPHYVVRVTQSGRTHDSFVYRHAHQDEHLRERGSDFNHWTTFSFSEGITVTNPQHFCLLSRGRLTTRNVKLFGWRHQTDGWGGGDGSSIEDSFIKVNDDSVKLYGKNQTARHLVIYQQVNGAPFQLGWGGSGQSAQHCLVEDIDVVACDAAEEIQRESNQAFLNLRNQSAESVIDGVTLRRLRFDCDLPMLVGFRQVKGPVRNIQFDGVTIHGRVNGRNFLRAEGTGSIAGLRLRDVTISGATAVCNGRRVLAWHRSTRHLDVANLITQENHALVAALVRERSATSLPASQRGSNRQPKGEPTCYSKRHGAVTQNLTRRSVRRSRQRDNGRIRSGPRPNPDRDCVPAAR